MGFPSFEPLCFRRLAPRSETCAIMFNCSSTDRFPFIILSQKSLIFFISALKLSQNSAAFTPPSKPGITLPYIMSSRSMPAFAKSFRHGSSLFRTPPLQPSSNTQKSPPFIPGGMLTTCSTPRDGSGSGLPVRPRSTPGAAILGQLSSYTSWRETGTYRSPLHS